MPPLVALVGPTSSGKSALAIALAKRFGGAIISADSRTVYRGMDIGTAKPSLTERQGIAHYGFDLVEPNERFTVYDFQRLAQRVIKESTRQHVLPIMVGGTGLYIDAVLYGFKLRAPADMTLRQTLQALPVGELQARVTAAGLSLPANSRNPRHLIRLLEAGPAPAQSRELRPNTLVLGILVGREVLRERIAARVEAMVAAGLVEEVRTLHERYGNIEALRTPGYKAFIAYLSGSIGLEDATRQFIQADVQLAKRQRTWFKRNLSIHWLAGDNLFAQAESLVADFLANQR